MPGKRAWLAAALAAMAVCRMASATGLLIPEDKDLPPLAIQYHRVEVDVEGAVATTRLKEAFLNSTDRRLEATFVFPVPKGAALTDFAMFINGKRQSGEVVEAGKARRIYQDIVRRLRDPGLLEYMDSGLLRMRVFPIEPKSSVKLEITYTHALPFESGVYEYTFPLKTGHKASQVLEDFTVTVNIASRQPIKSVYSPSHKVGVTRKDDHHAIVGFEQAGARLDTDFNLFYTVGEEDFGLNLLTHRLDGQDGYFALMISPRVEMPDRKVMAKDVCFVIDTSGSMQEENRIASARDALKFCLKALNRNDRFAIITFSSTVETYADGLQKATPRAVEDAVAFVDKLEARGGTDLCGAAVTALGMAPKGERPYLVVFATDGKPTVNITEPDEIVAEVQKANQGNVRVFPFGIAENLDVPLLDRIAEATSGYSEYVAPGREIEEKISSFFRKVSNPVLAGLALDFGKIKVSDIYPPHLPDLFRGSQVVAFGRYTGSGDVAVRLTGAIEDAKKSFDYDASFPNISAGNDFLPQLWARRKIGYMLDQIRLHGENEELVDEVTRLSTEYGIATPYTSYLVLEDEEAYRRHGILRGGAMGRLRAAGVARETAAAVPSDRADYLGTLAGEREMLQAPAAPGAGGANAVAFSKALRHLKEAEAGGEAAGAKAALQRVGERTFALLGGAYVDTAFEEDMETLKVKFGSDAYFNLLDVMPELTDCLALGETVVVVIGEKALIVADEGEEEMTADQIEEYFAK